MPHACHPACSAGPARQAPLSGRARAILPLAARCVWAVGLVTALASGAWAQSVALQGMLGSRALLMIDGGAPRSVAVGETVQGVRVVSTSSDAAVVEVGGKRLTLRLGESPASLGERGQASSGRISLPADGGGHFMGSGSINGRPVQFMVDTGASVVAIGQGEADRLGLNYKSGRQVMMNTANGAAPGWLFKINTLRVGDVVAYEVDTVVTPAAMPAILLGNSFLNRFNMRRDGDQMMLIKR